MTIKNDVKMPWEKDCSGLARGAIRYGTIKNATDLYCPDCGENLGKDKEAPKKAYCSTCGKAGIPNPAGYKNETPAECAGPDCDTTGPRTRMHQKDDENYCQECFDTLGLHENATYSVGDEAFIKSTSNVLPSNPKRGARITYMGRTVRLVEQDYMGGDGWWVKFES